MSTAIDRRHSPRYPTVKNAAVVEFKRRGRTRTVGASLVDISATGGLLRMFDKPRLHATLWVRLVHPLETPTLLATAVRIGDDGEVAVEFVNACDRTFFWTATRGEDFRSDSLAGSAEPADSR